MDQAMRYASTEAQASEVEVRIAPRDIRILVVAHVVTRTPALLVDGCFPVKAFRPKRLGPRHLIVRAVQHGVPDLHELQRLVQPQGDHTGREAHGLDADVQENASEPLHPS